MSALVTVLILAAVQVGGSFGEAEATTVSLEENSMVIDLTVEVTTSADAVIVHLGLDGETTRIPMLPREGVGVFGITTEVARKNWIVNFEILGPESEISQPLTLGFLGAQLSEDPEAEGPGESTDEGISRETRRWGFLGLALGAAALSLLAFWVLGGEDRKSKEDGGEEE